ncbi:hypothetical protein ACMHYB_28820 [Sorangium sp. So ce1128]
MNAGNGVPGPAFDAIAERLDALGVPFSFVRMHHDSDSSFPNEVLGRSGQHLSTLVEGMRARFNSLCRRLKSAPRMPLPGEEHGKARDHGADELPHLSKRISMKRAARGAIAAELCTRRTRRARPDVREEEREERDKQRVTPVGERSFDAPV